jgi:hypothetical protein
MTMPEIVEGAGFGEIEHLKLNDEAPDAEGNGNENPLHFRHLILCLRTNHFTW